MNKLKRFAETYAAQHPTELLHESADEPPGKSIASVTPDGKSIIIYPQWLDEQQARRLLTWLKDLLEEPTA